jgi:Flp pilus assembly protein TadD
MESNHGEERREDAPGPGPKRRWCVPPAILREPAETLEGSHVLDEVGGAVGLLLWQSLRDVTLWAGVPPEERAGLFAVGAGAHRQALFRAAAVEPALDMAVTTFTALADDPASASPPLLSLVCAQVARWAEQRGAGGTAVSFAQAAALAAPESARAAFAVGTLALRLRRFTRAESWLRRTVGLARRTRDWGPYADSYVDLGVLYHDRGNHLAARRLYLKAMRAARRHGLPGVRGAALHGMFRIALAEGRTEEAERLARAASRAYGKGHPRLPHLLHDLAALWVDQGRSPRAVQVLQRLLPHRAEPHEQVTTLALLARAAAGAGDRRAFEEAWTGAWSLLRRMEDEQVPPGTMVELARAAALVRDWDRMEQAVRHAQKGPDGEASHPGLDRLLGTLREEAP